MSDIKHNNNFQVQGIYNACVKEFIDELLEIDESVISSIVLYGSLCRDGKIILTWTDIDLFIFYYDIWKSNTLRLSQIIKALENKYNIRLDITRVNIDDLSSNNIKYYYYPSVISVLNNSGSPYKILYGNLPNIVINKSTEKEIAYKTTIFIEEEIRNLQLDKYYLDLNLFEKKKYDEKLIRLTNTYLRNALLVIDQYSDPYESLIENISKFYNFDISILQKMCSIRLNFEHYTPLSISLLNEANSLFSIVKPQIEKYYEGC